MKKTVRVTVEKEFEIEIPDEMLAPESVETFSRTIFSIDGPDDLFKHAARQIAEYGDHFVEGIGPSITFREMYSRGDAEVEELL